MSKWNQGAKFEDTASPAPAEVKEPPVTVQEGEDGKRSFKFGKAVIPVLIGLALLAAVVIIFVSARYNKDRMETPGTPASEEIIGQDPTGGIGEAMNPDDLLGEIDAFSYTEEERAELRACGYTADDIEHGISEKIPAEQLIEEAEHAQAEKWAALNDPASEEYQALLDQTWLGEAPTSLPEYSDTMVTSNTIKKLNADYVKIPAYGPNLFIKIDMGNGTHYFMQCDVVTYTKLADSGNINVQYNEYVVNGQAFIANMRQIEV